MPEPSAYHANLQRGSLLLNQGRPKEALPFLQAAIAANPDAAHGYAELARCFNEIPAMRSKSIGAINRAIGLAPNVSFYQGRKGWFYICLMQYRAAKNAANEGLAINPTCPQSLNALANAHTKLGQWKKAETACLRILEQNPNDSAGLNLLAQALRHLGRWKESRETVARLLANMPNNAFGHANAGYAALAAGDHLRANEHFRESLRMDPHFDLARLGLLQSLRARIWIIRLNTRFFSNTRRQLTWRIALTLLGATWLIIGLVIACAALEKTIIGTLLGYLLICLFFGGIIYIYLSAIVALMGNFLLIFDPLGRHALTREEKTKACIPAFFFAIVVGAFMLADQFAVAFGLVFFAIVLAFSIQFPLLKDRWLRRREKETES